MGAGQGDGDRASPNGNNLVNLGLWSDLRANIRRVSALSRLIKETREVV